MQINPKKPICYIGHTWHSFDPDMNIFNSKLTKKKSVEIEFY